jgi:hypothetical protein
MQPAVDESTGGGGGGAAAAAAAAGDEEDSDVNNDDEDDEDNRKPSAKEDEQVVAWKEYLAMHPDDEVTQSKTSMKEYLQAHKVDLPKHHSKMKVADLNVLVKDTPPLQRRDHSFWTKKSNAPKEANPPKEAAVGIKKRKPSPTKARSNKRSTRHKK